MNWIDLNIETPHHDDIVVYLTKNGKLFITHHRCDEWLINKYNLTHYIVLPKLNN